MDVKLISYTPEPEKILLYCARVSNPKNQNSGNTKLITYLIDNKHWSPFSMVNFVFEVTTSRAISAQICRHWSIGTNVQEFSQRYAKVPSYELYTARLQDVHNRQNSLATDDVDLQTWFTTAQHEINSLSHQYYTEALRRGIAKEQARFLLTEATTTRLYLNGNLRSWIHYLDLRDHEHAQLEHQEIARAIKNILVDLVPITAAALGWVDTSLHGGE